MRMTTNVCKPDVAGTTVASGNLGSIAHGELVVCGYALKIGYYKDFVLIGGRNMHPEEIRQSVASGPGVRSGDIAAFAECCSDSDTYAVTGALELSPDYDEKTAQEQVSEAMLADVNIRPVALPTFSSGAIEKTKSWELQCTEAVRWRGGEK